MNYHVTVFGVPAESKPWAWRFEGHHLSLNFTLLNGSIGSSTPSCFGANPGIVKEGESKGLQVLKQETNLGFELVNSFTPEQRKTVLISETAPAETITGNTRKAVPLTPDGLSFKNMNGDQQKIMLQLLDVYVKNYAFGFSSKLMETRRRMNFRRRPTNTNWTRNPYRKLPKFALSGTLH